ncbi:MAG: hypothetical protein AAF447_16855 [Myxococcota bacterium]
MRLRSAITPILTAVLLTAAPACGDDAEGDGGGGFCQAGTLDCICLLGNCQDDLVCEDGICNACPFGTAGCPCGDACDDGLTCARTAPPEGRCNTPVATLSGMAGTWRGTFTNSAGSTGESTFELTVDAATGDVSLTYDQSGANPGGPDPGEEALTTVIENEGADTLDRVLTAFVQSQFHGDVRLTLQTDGSFNGTSETDGLDNQVFGDIGQERIYIIYVRRTQAGSEVGRGTAVFERGPLDGVPTVTSPEADCGPVAETSGAGGACDASCMPPDGECIDGVCRQACSPGLCEQRCGAQELCQGNPSVVSIAPELTFGACVPPPVGATPSYATCTAPDCVEGNVCLAFSGEPAGVCSPFCATDGDCPAAPGFDVACVLGNSAGGGKRFCSTVCEFGGSATCPEGFTCVPSLAGGTCRPAS